MIFAATSLAKSYASSILMNQRKVANHKYPQDNSVPTERLEVVFLDVIQQETNRQVSDYEGHDHPNG